MRKVKLSWEDQIKMKKKKEEDMINLHQSEQRQSIEVKVYKKSTTDEPKNVDFYDSYIIEKALSNLKSEIEKHSPKTKNTSDDAKMELEFHEQYFS
jgi:ribosome-associated translation inhibitor RaiA